MLSAPFNAVYIINVTGLSLTQQRVANIVLSSNGRTAVVRNVVRNTLKHLSETRKLTISLH